MIRITDRRRFCLTAFASAVISPPLSAQRTSPAGTITVDGGIATFSVDYGRPLESVVYTLTAKFGWRITFEEAPLVYTEDMVDMTRNPSATFRSYNPRGGKLEFSCQMGPGGKPPEDPVTVLRAAIEAHHKADFPGRYDVIPADGYLHIVPTAHRGETGHWQPVRSPFEAAVTVIGGGRTTWPVYNDLLRAVEGATGYHIGIGSNPFYQGDLPSINQRFENVRARSVLKSLISALGRPKVWYLMNSPGRKEYGLSVV